MSGIMGGTALTCIAPRTRFEKQLDLIGISLFIAALALIGAALSGVYC